MSSTEEDDSFTPQNVNTDTVINNSPEFIDPDSFARKCNISTVENDCSSRECVDNVPVDPQAVLETKKARNQPMRASIYDNFIHPCVPKINCPEKIFSDKPESIFLFGPWLKEAFTNGRNRLKILIFCIDMSSEMEDIPFRKNDGSQHSALNMVKRTIELFVHNKHYIDKKHEYSLMVLYESATWVREFTNDPMELIDSLEDLNETQPCTSCDLGSIVQLISEKFELVVPINLIPVQYAIRVILIYGRSNCMFYFSDEQLQDTLTRYPFLFLDILYIHEPPSENNQCKEIYDALCDLDEQNKSYIYEVTHNVTKLHNCMAKFLAHPLQRVAQKDTFYKIRDVESAEET